MNPQQIKKPPLGLMPREVSVRNWRMNRRSQITTAIQNYLDDGETPIPVEWVKEYNDLLAIEEAQS